MSDEIERGPCPRCGEPVSLAARACPHCKGNLLVDVSLQSAPADGRARYQIARALAACGPPAPSFAAAQQAVAIPHSVLVSGATRELAQRVLELLEEHGGRGRTTAAVKDVPAADRAPASRVPTILVFLLIAAVAGFALWNWARRIGGEGGDDEIELPTRAAHFAAQGPALSSTALAARLAPATVRLRCRTSVGSGFFVAEGLVLTSAHALCPPGELLLAALADGRELPATPGQRNDWLDLALVQVPGAGIPPLPLGDATALRTGDRVLSNGAAEGQSAAVHQGTVSRQARNRFGIAFLQVGADMGPGSAGGPLLDTHGRVVGVLAARSSQGSQGAEGTQGMAFALPINYVYAGARRLLPPPVLPRPDERSWSDLLADVATADRREVQRATEAGSGRPALLELVTVPGKGSAAVVARRAIGTPRAEPLTFLFSAGERALCRVTAPADDWHPVEANAAQEQAADSRYIQWVKKNGLQKDVYVGLASLDLQGCPLEELHGSDLILEGADERASRIGVP
jgi:S1-C subfamily serine protease